MLSGCLVEDDGFLGRGRGCGYVDRGWNRGQGCGFFGCGRGFVRGDRGRGCGGSRDFDWRTGELSAPGDRDCEFSGGRVNSVVEKDGSENAGGRWGTQERLLKVLEKVASASADLAKLL